MKESNIEFQEAFMFLHGFLQAGATWMASTPLFGSVVMATMYSEHLNSDLNVGKNNYHKRL